MNRRIIIERIPIFCPPWWAWDVTWRPAGSDGKGGGSVSTWLVIALVKAWWRSRRAAQG